MNIIQRSTAYQTPKPKYAPSRNIYAVVLHHTGGASPVPCHSNGSWHYMIDRDGTIYADVPEENVAWHVRAADRWRPLWLSRGCNWANCSDVNTCTIGIEIVSVAGSAEITEEQHDSLKYLCYEFQKKYGDLWYVGHGELQSDRRLTEPDNLDWKKIGCSDFDNINGRSWSVDGGDDLNDDEKLVVTALRETGYPAVEAAKLIRMFSGLYANTESVNLWVNQIGALEEENKNLKEQLQPVESLQEK